MALGLTFAQLIGVLGFSVMVLGAIITAVFTAKSHSATEWKSTAEARKNHIDRLEHELEDERRKGK